MTVVAVAALSSLSVTTGALADTGQRVTGHPGARTAGERLFPHLGNGGYDARSYDVHFDYRPGTSLMRSEARMEAVATEDLSQFSLDSAAQTIHAVTVDGRPAAFATLPSDEKLVVTPQHVLPRGGPFTVVVSYTADRSKNPAPPGAGLPDGVAWPIENWVTTTDGFAFMGQPDRAHLFFPSDDVPRDKARISFSITTPDGVDAVANGHLVSRRHADGRTTVTYRTRDAIPTDVSQVAVGSFRTVTQQGPHGLPVRSFLPADHFAETKEAAERTPAQIAWLEATLGLRFPFESYGVLGLDSAYDGVALETATLSTFSEPGLALPGTQESPVMVHELAHQYFGDAVSVHDWDDMWLSEGHASYYQRLYEAGHGGSPLADTMHGLYTDDAGVRAVSGPAGHLDNQLGVLFDTDSAGSLMLYGLHNLVGDATFHAIERTFFLTYQGRSASTQDYIDTANRVSGRDLGPYIKGWIYGKTTPPMPGHPDWKPGTTG